MLLTLLKRTALGFLIPLFLVVMCFVLASRLDMFEGLRKFFWVFWVLIVLILVLWVVVVVFQFLAQRKRAQAIEQGILKQAQWNADNATPARRAEIEEIKKSLGEAMATLQKGPDGKKALYSLPWYMIIGPPATGKTTAIVNSGLNFPNMTTARRMRGAGGTRNCDWWFSTDAILLDTAGRYAQSSDRSETETEWFGFLDLLKKNRSNGPINGLILAYSMETLVAADDNRLVNDARELRQRMDEILDRLGWTFPVYVLVTKCDLVGGFAEFFSALSPAERQQVWGMTTPIINEADQKVAERADQEFDLLTQRLREVRTRRMAVLDHGDTWGKVFMFPEEFTAVRNRLHLFMETLFEPNPFRKDHPLFRGIYFSSGKQLGRPFELVVQKIQAMLGMAVSFAGGENQPEKEDAYFVRDLFAKVLKGDREVVRRTNAASNKWARLQLFTTIGVAAFAILSCLWIAFSYGSLQLKMQKTLGTAKRVSGAKNDQSNMSDQIDILDKLREDVDQGWSVFPLFVGGRVRERGRAVYLDAARERVLKPVEEDLSDILDSPSSRNSNEVRKALKGELLMLYPNKRDDIDGKASDLAQCIIDQELTGQEVDKPRREKVEKLAEEFLRAERPLTDPTIRRRQLLAGADRLTRTHVPEEYFEGMVDEANDHGDPVTLESLAGPNRLLTGTSTVGFAFTKSGWEQAVSDALNNVDDVIKSDNKMIRLAGGTPGGVVPDRARLMSLYATAVGQEWAGFFTSVRLNLGGDCAAMQSDLDALRKQTSSPLFKLLRNAKDQVDFSAMWEGITKAVGFSDKDRSALKSAVKPIYGFSTPPVKDGNPPSGEYAAQLNSALGQIADCAEKGTDVDPKVMRAGATWASDYAENAGGSELALAIGNLLQRPFKSSEEAGKESATQGAEKKAAKDVSGKFEDDLAGKYPLSRNGASADVSAITSYFSKDGAFEASGTTVTDKGQNLSDEYKSKLDQVKRIRESLNMTSARLSVSMTVRSEGVTSISAAGKNALQEIDQVVLVINGESMTHRLGGPKDQGFTWSSDAPAVNCSISLGSSDSPDKLGEVKGDDSPWSFFRLLDQAKLTREGNGWRCTWEFPDQGVAYSAVITPRGGLFPFDPRSDFRTFSPPAQIVAP